MNKNDQARHLVAVAKGHKNIHYGWRGNVFKYVINELKKHNILHVDDKSQMFDSIYDLDLSRDEIESLKTYYFANNGGLK